MEIFIQTDAGEIRCGSMAGGRLYMSRNRWDGGHDWATVSFLFYDPVFNDPNKRFTEEERQACLDLCWDEPEIIEKLEKWRNGAVKRLEKSVPRLREEYERAQKSYDALKNSKFTPR